MDIATAARWLGWIMAAGIAAMTALMVHALYNEAEYKAALRVAFLGGTATVVWGGILLVQFTYQYVFLVAGLLLALAFGLAMVLPNGKPEVFTTEGEIERFDERDMMFSRSALAAGTENYDEYYDRHPERRETDDGIRGMPQICGKGTSTYHELNSPLADAAFWLLGDINKYAEGPAAPHQVEVDPEQMTERLKGLAQYYGAKLVGVTEVKPHHLYTHIGRRPAEYGNEVNLSHKYAIAFAVEMDYHMVKSAPNVQVVAESSRQYVEAGKIALVLAYYIRSLGYEARAHMDGNYLVLAPIVAADAGLGEIGRMGLLMTEDYGPRVRLGVVTTDIPLVPDKPVNLGMQNFCRICKKCADNCPSRSISHGDKEYNRGVRKWTINQETCFRWWRTVGTDCAICMNACPYSKPNTLIHKLMRYSLRRSEFARRFAVWVDDLIYGRRPYRNILPKWMG